MRTMHVTRKDIAAKVGVSVSTVGMILDGYGQRYSETTRAKVLEVAETMGYRPNLVGRSLRTGRSYLLGLLYFVVNGELVSDFLRGAIKVIEGLEYSPIVLSFADLEEEKNSVRRCLNRRVDGLVVNTSITAGASAIPAPYGDLADRGLPMIEVFGRALTGVPSVNIDNEAAGRAAVELLVARGHRRIAMVTHEHYAVAKDAESHQHFDAWERYRGYERAMKDAGLKPLVITHPIVGEQAPDEARRDFLDGGMAAMEDLLRRPNPPTAVVTLTDWEAVGMMRVCRARGLPAARCPALIGFGDNVSAFTEPPLSTFAMPSYDVGKAAMRMILDRIEGRVPSSVLVQSRFVDRGIAPPG